MSQEDPELRILEKAIEKETGVKLAFRSKSDRDSFRMRLYRRRDRDRRQAAQVADLPIMKGLSPYDSLAMKYFTAPDGRPAMHITSELGVTLLDDEGTPTGEEL